MAMVAEWSKTLVALKCYEGSWVPGLNPTLDFDIDRSEIEIIGWLQFMSRKG